MLSRTIYVTHISDRSTISDPRVPAPHPHAGKLGLDGTTCQERLLGDDVIRHSGDSIPLTPFILFRF